MNKKLIYGLFFLAFALAVGFSAFRKWAVNHATYMTGGVPHPINCAPCHIYPERDGILANILNEDYLSPLNAVCSSDGSALYVIAQDADMLLIVDPAQDKVETQIAVGRRPHSVVVSKDGKSAYVSNQWDNNLYVIDLASNTVSDTILTGAGPAGMGLSVNGQLLYIANTYTNNISVVDLASNTEIKRLYGGNYPTGVAVSPLDNQVFVSSQRTLPVPFRTEPITEVTVLNGKNQRVEERLNFRSAHIMENIAVSPDGDMAITTLIRPKNLVPSAQIERGWMINHGIGIVTKEGKKAQLLLDEPNAFYADPYDVVIHPNGKYAYVSHAGADMISAIDLDVVRNIVSQSSQHELENLANYLGMSDQIVLKRIKTGANPRGLALSPDGKTLYAVEQMTDHITMIDTEKLEVVKTIDLGGPSRTTVTRKGGQLFRNAGHTFHQQYSCYTCHPDGHEDGLTYDLTGSGRDLANVQTLRDLNGTAPFKWNGKNVSVYMQCGMRFSKFVTRTESFSPGDLNSLVAYIMRELTHPPNIHALPGGELTEAQKRGKAIFERTITVDGREIPEKDQCITCHNGPSYSNFQMADVGSLKDTDNPTLFDSPNLNNVYESAPYLHDGSAATLEEIWTVFNPNDTHGYANDMTKDQLNDLVEYLKSLKGAEYTSDQLNYEVNKSQL
ncbi:MAG: c-type cytochrome [Cyclobacteriaceae bacterium]|nr:c-type cytochrome [Cyclobacteriaceae bacterium]